MGETQIKSQLQVKSSSKIRKEKKNTKIAVGLLECTICFRTQKKGENSRR